jgi:hypothetical protein
VEVRVLAQQELILFLQTEVELQIRIQLQKAVVEELQVKSDWVQLRLIAELSSRVVEVVEVQIMQMEEKREAMHLEIPAKADLQMDPWELFTQVKAERFPQVVQVEGLGQPLVVQDLVVVASAAAVVAVVATSAVEEVTLKGAEQVHLGYPMPHPLPTQVLVQHRMELFHSPTSTQPSQLPSQLLKLRQQI